MLFYLYIGSTVYVWCETFNHQKNMKKRLKEEGYKFTTNNYIGLADIVIGGFYLVALSIPVFNLLFPLSHHNKDRAYDEYKNYLLDAGAIELNELPKEEIKKHVLNLQNTKLVERVNQNGRTYYSTMYRGEEDTLDEGGYTYKKSIFSNNRR